MIDYFNDLYKKYFNNKSKLQNHQDKLSINTNVNNNITLSTNNAVQSTFNNSKIKDANNGKKIRVKYNLYDFAHCILPLLFAIVLLTYGSIGMYRHIKNESIHYNLNIKNYKVYSKNCTFNDYNFKCYSVNICMYKRNYDKNNNCTCIFDINSQFPSFTMLVIIIRGCSVIIYSISSHIYSFFSFFIYIYIYIYI